MAVKFENMPGVLRVPLFYAEVNGGPPAYSGRSPLIYVGRATTAGVLPKLKPVQVGSQQGSAPGNYLAGPGSMLADQLAFGRYHNPLGEIWAMAVEDPVGGTAAVGAITFSGTATSSGTLVRYIAGERYSIGIAAGDTAAAVATAFVAAIGRGYTKFGLRMGAPVTAAVDGVTAGKVNLTARHTGLEGNGIRIEDGLDGDEMEVPGLTVTLTPMTGGAGDIDMVSVLAALGKLPFDWISSPYASLAALNASRDFLSDSGSGRWSPTVDLDGHYITAVNGNLSALTTLGGARNDRHASIVGVLNYPHPLWSINAAVSGVVAFYKNLGRSLTEATEIAAPLTGLVLSGIRPPKAASDRWGGDDLAALYNNGISALQINADGSVAINRILTTYRVNLYGSADDTFLSISAIAIGAYLKRYSRLKVTSTYPRHVLKDDNPRGNPRIVTDEQIRNTLIHAYTELANIAGIVDKPELYAQYLVVERSADSSRVNAYMPSDMADEFIALAANITLFRELTPENASLL